MLGYPPQGGIQCIAKHRAGTGDGAGTGDMELAYKDFVVYVGMHVRILKLGASNKYTNFTKGTDKKCYVCKHGRHIVSRP